MFPKDTFPRLALEISVNSKEEQVKDNQTSREYCRSPRGSKNQVASATNTTTASPQAQEQVTRHGMWSLVNTLTMSNLAYQLPPEKKDSLSLTPMFKSHAKTSLGNVSLSLQN